MATKLIDTDRSPAALLERVDFFRLGDLIREFRERQHLTQARFARKVGTSQSAIARIEDANYTGQKLGTIAKIAAALGHQVEVNLVKVTA